VFFFKVVSRLPDGHFASSNTNMWEVTGGCQAMGIAGIPGYHPLIEYLDCALTALWLLGTLGPRGPSHNQTYYTANLGSVYLIRRRRQ
jgi:hypothetical protein